MRARQPTVLFGFTVIVGVARALAYTGTDVARDLSFAALAHYAVLHVLAFSMAALLVAAFSRATATRAAQVAMSAQFALFVGPFVDVALGASVLRYEDTYVAVFGSPGALLSGLAYGAVLGWGMWESAIGTPPARATTATIGGVLGIVGLAFVATPWPRGLVESATTLPWGVHLALAVYSGILACISLALAVAAANRVLHRELWRRTESLWLPVALLMPLAGVVVSGHFGIPQIALDSAPAFQIVTPYVLSAMAVGGLLWTQRRILRMEGGGPMRVEIARIVKLAVLVLALFLGPVAFLVAGLAASLVWLERDRASPFVLGAIAGLAVVIGDTTVAAVDSSEAFVGPIAFRIAIYAWTLPSVTGMAVAIVVAAIVTVVGRATIRTSASGTGRASS